MSLLLPRKNTVSLKRLRFILGTVFEYGGKPALDALKLRYLVPLRCRVHCFLHHRPQAACRLHPKGPSKPLSPSDWRVLLEKLGPTFIKFGQVLSLRADVIGEDMAGEFAKLQSHVPTFPYAEAREIIKQELGAYPEQLFRSFGKKPIAGASLAQVHKAVLKTGQKVAVKIQRPGIITMIREDIRILYFLADAAEAHMPGMRSFRPREVVREFSEWTERELDFRIEAQNAARFAAMFAGEEGVNIPRVYNKYSGARVLTMDFADGVHADDIVGMKRRGIDPRRVAENGIRALLRQFFIEGFFHADPHPGNFFAMKGNAICLHDFGMVGQLTEKQRQELLSCFLAFVEQDVEGYQKHFLHLAETDAARDIKAYKKDIAFLLNEFYYAPKQPSIAWAFFRLVNAGRARNVRFPTELVLFAKAMITAEAMGLKLYPNFRFNEQFKPFVREAYREFFHPKRLARAMKADALDTLETLRRFPERMDELMENIQSGRLGVKIDAQELYDLKAEFDRQNDVRLLGLVLTAVLILTGTLLYMEGVRTVYGVSLGRVGIGVSIFLLLWFLAKLRGKPKTV